MAEGDVIREVGVIANVLLGGVILGQGLSVPALLVQQTRQVSVSVRVISWTLIHQGLGPRQILLPISEMCQCVTIGLGWESVCAATLLNRL